MTIKYPKDRVRAWKPVDAEDERSAWKNTDEMYHTPTLIFSGHTGQDRPENSWPTGYRQMLHPSSYADDVDSSTGTPQIIFDESIWLDRTYPKLRIHLMHCAVDMDTGEGWAPDNRQEIIDDGAGLSDWTMNLSIEQIAGGSDWPNSDNILNADYDIDGLPLWPAPINGADHFLYSRRIKHLRSANEEGWCFREGQLQLGDIAYFQRSVLDTGILDKVSPTRISRPFRLRLAISFDEVTEWARGAEDTSVVEYVCPSITIYSYAGDDN